MHKDLVQRLRQPSDFYFTDQMTAKKANALYTSLLQDGADAIEKLEAENAQLKESRDEYSEAVERLSVNREEMLKDRVALAIENERLKAELAARWIPVSERLPKAYDEVMVWPHPSNNSMTADINTIGTWRSGEYKSGFGWTENVFYPTHWMPLPAAPGAMP